MPINLETGRDELGQFASKQAIQQAALREIEKQKRAVEKVNAQYREQKKITTDAFKSYRKHFNAQEKKVLRGYKRQQKELQKQTKMQIRDATKVSREKLKAVNAEMRAQRKLHREQTKVHRMQMKSLRERARVNRGGGGLGLPGLGIGGIAGALGIGALSIAVKKISDYVSQLAWARQYARALAGSFRDISNVMTNRRDIDLFTQFAQQDFRNRFAGQTELTGLKNLRESLQKSLGENAGTELSLKLTESLKDDQRALQSFLAMASQDVPAAIAAFQSADIQDFSTALAAVNMESDELADVAFTLEQAWRDVKDSFEKFAIDFIQQNGVDLKNIIQDIAGGVVDLINSGRHLAAEFKPIFDFLRKGFEIVRDAALGVKYIWDIFATSVDMEGVNQIDKRLDDLIAKHRRARDMGNDREAKNLMRQIKMMQRFREGIMSGARDRLTDAPEIKDLTLKAAVNVDEFKMGMQDAIDKTKQERDALNEMLTPIQRAKQEIQSIDDDLKLLTARQQAEQSRLQMLESSPLGFGQSMEQT